MDEVPMPQDWLPRVATHAREVMLRPAHRGATFDAPFFHRLDASQCEPLDRCSPSLETASTGASALTALPALLDRRDLGAGYPVGPRPHREPFLEAAARCVPAGDLGAASMLEGASFRVAWPLARGPARLFAP